MTFDVDNFKEVGSVGNQRQGGQTYAVSSDTDVLSTMMAQSYLDAIQDKLNERDMVLLTGTNGSALVQVSKSGTVITSVGVVVIGPGAAFSGPGALSTEVPFTDITTTGADAFTLADGNFGQLMVLTLVVDGGNAVITPATRLGYATITMADAGDSVQLMFKSGGWAVIGQGGVGTGPVVA